MTVKDIVSVMEQEIAPLTLACGWDSPGLKAGSLQTPVSKVLVCLDLTCAAVGEAVKKGCGMIVTHHPAIFHPVSELTEDRHPALCSAVRSQIAVYSGHTNLDFAPGGVNDALCGAIGLSNVKQDASGEHRYGTVSGLVPLNEFLSAVKEKLGIPYVSAVLPQQEEGEPFIETVGVSCGAFDGETDWIYEHGIDLLLTGEIKHADLVALSEEQFITIGAGHYYTEIFGMRKLAEALEARGIPAVLAQSCVPPAIFL